MPYGVIVHGTDLLILQHQAHQSGMKRRMARSLLRPASVMVANSRYTRDLCLAVVSEIGAVRDPAKVGSFRLAPIRTTSGPGVDTSAVRARYGLDEGRWLLTVARLTVHKGIDTGIQRPRSVGAGLPRPPLPGGRAAGGRPASCRRWRKARRGRPGPVPHQGARRRSARPCTMRRRSISACPARRNRWWKASGSRWWRRPPAACR